MTKRERSDDSYPILPSLNIIFPESPFKFSITSHTHRFCFGGLVGAVTRTSAGVIANPNLRVFTDTSSLYMLFFFKIALLRY